MAAMFGVIIDESEFVFSSGFVCEVLICVIGIFGRSVLGAFIDVLRQSRRFMLCE